MSKDTQTAHKTEYILMSDIRADDAFNCRGQITMPSVIELANNIRKQGLLQPIVVGPIEEDGKRLLVAGYRRYKAHAYLKYERIFCVIRDDLTDHHALMLMNLQENLQRVNLDILEEGRAIQRLIDEGVGDVAKVAKLLNRNQAWVETKLQSILLPKELHKDILAGTFTAKNVRELYKSMTTKSVEQFYEDVRWLKDEKYKGKKNVTLNLREAERRKEVGAKQRCRAEVYSLQKKLSDTFGVECLASKVLGWVNGHVTGTQLDDAVQDELSKCL